MGKATHSTGSGTGKAIRSGTGPELVPDTWTALRALVARTGAGLVIDGDGSAPTERPAIVVVTKVLAAPVASGLRAMLAERSEAGSRTLLAVAPAAAGAVRELGTGVVPDESPLRVPSAANPTVADPRVRLAGLPGVLAGRTFAAADVVALLGDGTPLACADGHPAVVGTDSLIVVGSARMLSDEWIAADDNAWLAVWALTGRSGHEGPADVRAHRPTTHARHAAPPVIRVDEGTWDLGLLGDLTPADAGFVRAAGHAGRLLPAAVHDALVDFADAAPPLRARCSSRACRSATLPATPDRPTAVTTKDHVASSRCSRWRAGSASPSATLPEHGGDVVQNILPTRTNVTRQISTSSAVTLMFHTEAAFHPHRPRYLLLIVPARRSPARAPPWPASTRSLAAAAAAGAAHAVRAPLPHCRRRELPRPPARPARRSRCRCCPATVGPTADGVRRRPDGGRGRRGRPPRCRSSPSSSPPRDRRDARSRRPAGGRQHGRRARPHARSPPASTAPTGGCSAPSSWPTWPRAPADRVGRVVTTQFAG